MREIKRNGSFFVYTVAPPLKHRDAVCKNGVGAPHPKCYVHYNDGGGGGGGAALSQDSAINDVIFIDFTRCPLTI